jgi:hypothetical protein
LVDDRVQEDIQRKVGRKIPAAVGSEGVYQPLYVRSGSRPIFFDKAPKLIYMVQSAKSKNETCEYPPSNTVQNLAVAGGSLPRPRREFRRSNCPERSFTRKGGEVNAETRQRFHIVNGFPQR